MNISIVSAALSIPSKRVSNTDLETSLDTSDEWIYSHTGIRHRYICTKENCVDLGTEAAQRALKKAKIDPNDVSMIVVATSTPYYAHFPSTACVIQDRLGIEHCCSYDISAACTGFIYAFMNAAYALECEKKEYALVIGTEVLSSIVDWKDRSTCILFGDGAGAVVLRRSTTQSTILSSFLDSETRDFTSLTSGAPVDGGSRSLPLTMDGRKVYNFAVNVLPKTISILLQKAGIGHKAIDMVIAHQANTRIIQSAAKKLAMPIEKFYINMKHYANTSAASIPIALAEMQEKNLFREGNVYAIVGFGAGLTYGGVLLKW